MYYTYVPENAAICQRCSQPSLTTCAICNTSFLCEEGGRCQQPIIGTQYSNKILYNFLRIMGSLKTKPPCHEHISGGTETSHSQISFNSFPSSVSNTPSLQSL